MPQLQIGLAADVQRKLAELAADHGHARSADYVQQIANELLASVLATAADEVLAGDTVLIPISVVDVARLLTFDTERRARDGDLPGIDSVEVEDLNDDEDDEAHLRWAASLAANATLDTASALFVDLVVDANPFTSTDDVERIVRSWGTL